MRNFKSQGKHSPIAVPDVDLDGNATGPPCADKLRLLVEDLPR